MSQMGGNPDLQTSCDSTQLEVPNSDSSQLFYPNQVNIESCHINVLGTVIQYFAVEYDISSS